MENQVLVTGLWMGSEDLQDEYCLACNYEYSWLFDNPSTLIWSDKIIITPYIQNTIEEERYPETDSACSKIIKKTFEVMEQYDLVDIKKPGRILTKNKLDQIFEEATRDRMLLEKLYPQQIRVEKDSKVPGEIFVNGQHYCRPHIGSIYASLILAKEWDARCLFSDNVFNYCKYKFGLSLLNESNIGYEPSPFKTIMNSFLPEIDLFPAYVFNSENPKMCETCSEKSMCNNTYLGEYENNLIKYLELRDYDEIIQIKNLISDIIYRLESQKDDIGHQDIINEFNKEERIITKRIRQTFPKINRWSNIALLISLPITFVGASTGLPMVTTFGLGIAGASKIMTESVKYLENKYKWVGFRSKKVLSPTSK